MHICFQFSVLFSLSCGFFFGWKLHGSLVYIKRYDERDYLCFTDDVIRHLYSSLFRKLRWNINDSLSFLCLGSASKTEHESALASEVPAPPKNTVVGGKAALQPERTPVTANETDAILVSKILLIYNNIFGCSIFPVQWFCSFCSWADAFKGECTKQKLTSSNAIKKIKWSKDVCYYVFNWIIKH